MTTLTKTANKQGVETGYLSVKQIAEEFKIEPSLIRGYLGHSVEEAVKKKVKGQLAYPIAHPTVKQFLKYGSGGVITASTVKTDYKLKEDDLSKLICNTADNPHYKCAKPMRLFYRKEVENYLASKSKKNN